MYDSLRATVRQQACQTGNIPPSYTALILLNPQQHAGQACCDMVFSFTVLVLGIPTVAQPLAEQWCH